MRATLHQTLRATAPHQSEIGPFHSTDLPDPRPGFLTDEAFVSSTESSTAGRFLHGLGT